MVIHVAKTVGTIIPLPGISIHAMLTDVNSSSTLHTMALMRTMFPEQHINTARRAI